MFGRKKKESSEFCFEIKARGGSSISIDTIRLVRSVTSIHPKAILKIETIFTSRGHRSLIRITLPSNTEPTYDYVKVLETILQSLLPPDVNFARVDCDSKHPF